jgi:hypothetical protein
MKTNKSLRRISFLLILISVVLLNITNGKAQTNYMLDLSDASTFTTTCGTNNGNLWTVSNSTCTLTTPELQMPPDPPVQNLVVSVTLEGASMDRGDTLKIEYKENGVWHTVTYITGEPGVHTYPYSFILPASANALVSVRIVMGNNAKTESWRLWSGRLSIVPENPLPVTLLRFSGERSPEGVRIAWATATETNCDFFTLQRSEDGQDFFDIKRVPAIGNSSTEVKYSVMDYEVPEGVNYYRLLQTDFNGDVQHVGTILSVNFCRNKNPLHIYPNPNDGSLFYIHVNDVKGDKIAVIINDESGREVFSGIMPYYEYAPVVEVTGFNQRLVPGIYVVTATCENDLCKQKILVK